MSKVIKIGVAKTSGEQIIDLDAVEIIAGKGIVNDRHFSENNDDRCQITLIESENIDFYNSKTKNDIPYINFRRNIITKGIKLNSLLEKKINNNIIFKVRELEETARQNEIKMKKLSNKGKKNDWKKLLNNKIAKKIENTFNSEMKELNYL